jgi:hypothetical protein
MPSASSYQQVVSYLSNRTTQQASSQPSVTNLLSVPLYLFHGVHSFATLEALVAIPGKLGLSRLRRG